MTQEMVRPTDDLKGTTLQMRVSAAYLKSIDEWRRLQPDLPSRSEAIRRLTTAALRGPAMSPEAAHELKRSGHSNAEVGRKLGRSGERVRQALSHRKRQDSSTHLSLRSASVLREILHTEQIDPKPVSALSADDIRAAGGSKKVIEDIRAWLRSHGRDLQLP
jgi:hypothetical protein